MSSEGLMCDQLYPVPRGWEEGWGQGDACFCYLLFENSFKQRFVSLRKKKQSIDLQCELNDWLLYDPGFY